MNTLPNGLMKLICCVYCTVIPQCDLKYLHWYFQLFCSDVTIRSGEIYSHVWDLLRKMWKMWNVHDYCKIIHISVFESSQCGVVWGVRGCMWKVFLFYFCLHSCLQLCGLPANLHHSRSHISICRYLITFKCCQLTANPWTMHLNSTQQLLTWWLRFYRKYCAKPCQHFMQDEPASSWSKYSNMFQVIIIVIFLHCQRDHWCKIGWIQLFFLWNMVPNAMVKPVYKPCSELNYHLDQTSPLTQIIPVCAPDWGSSNSVCIYGEKKQCVVYIFNVQISL